MNMHLFKYIAVLVVGIVIGLVVSQYVSEPNGVIEPSSGDQAQQPGGKALNGQGRSTAIQSELNPETVFDKNQALDEVVRLPSNIVHKEELLSYRKQLRKQGLSEADIKELEAHDPNHQLLTTGSLMNDEI